MSPSRPRRHPTTRRASSLGLALAALLACRPVTPTSPEPGGPGPGPSGPSGLNSLHGPSGLNSLHGPSGLNSGDSTEPSAPIAPATPDPLAGDSPDPAATQGPGITTDATQTTQVTSWDGAPHQLLYRPGSPGGWPDLPGRAVGVLWSVALYNGSTGCVARNAGDPVQYQFSRGPLPSYSLYFQSDGRGFNFIPQWIVPLPDGTTTRVDAAMFRPDTANPWGLHACAHLVELAVNAGRGGRGLHFIGSDVRVLDGTTAFPWQLARVLADLRARTLTHAEAQRAALRSSTAGPGPWTEEKAPGMLVTWLPDADRLEVIVWSTTTRTATRALGRETVKPSPCPPNAPCAYREVGTFERREVQRETVDFAVRYELDRTARLLHETIYAPRHRSTAATDRVRIHD